MTEIDEERMEQAAEQAEAISAISESLVDSAVAAAASDAGRTPEEQWRQMEAHYEYMAVEQDPDQKQLDDYELTGDTVEVAR